MAQPLSDNELEFIASEMTRTMTPSPENACGEPAYNGPCVLEKGHYGFVGHWSAEDIEREKHWPCVRDEVACSDPKCPEIIRKRHGA